MATGLIDIMKRASLDAMDANQTCDLRFGTVVSILPLKVQITNQFTIPEGLLIVPQHLTDYEIEVTTDGYGWETQNHTHTHTITDTFTSGGSASIETHKHTINQTKRKIKIHGALKVNDKVALIRKTGGQSYYILDRI